MDDAGPRLGSPGGRIGRTRADRPGGNAEAERVADAGRSCGPRAATIRRSQHRTSGSPGRPATDGPGVARTARFRTECGPLPIDRRPRCKGPGSGTRNARVATALLAHRGDGAEGV